MVSDKVKRVHLLNKATKQEDSHSHIQSQIVVVGAPFIVLSPRHFASLKLKPILRPKNGSGLSSEQMQFLAENISRQMEKMRRNFAGRTTENYRATGHRLRHKYACTSRERFFVRKVDSQLLGRVVVPSEWPIWPHPFCRRRP